MAVRHMTGFQDAALTEDSGDAGSAERADSGIRRGHTSSGAKQH